MSPRQPPTGLSTSILEGLTGRTPVTSLIDNMGEKWLVRPTYKWWWTHTHYYTLTLTPCAQPDTHEAWRWALCRRLRNVRRLITGLPSPGYLGSTCTPAHLPLLPHLRTTLVVPDKHSTGSARQAEVYRSAKIGSEGDSSTFATRQAKL